MNFLKWAWDNVISISIICSPAVTIAMWAVRSTFPSKAQLRNATAAINKRLDREIAAINEKFAAHRTDITRIEGAMTGLATKEDVSRILVALERQDGARNALNEKVEGIKAEIVALARPLDLIHEHLLNERNR